MSAKDQDIIRVFLFRIDSGDRRKFVAKANDTPSGGGPRDLRIRPEDKFWPFFEKLLTKRETVSRPRSGGTAEILIDTVHWIDDKKNKSARIEIWPHQKKRPNECRIAKVYKWNATHLIETDPSAGLSVLMLFQQANGVLRLFFTTETILVSGNWNPTIKAFAKSWITQVAKNAKLKSAFLDLQTKESYPDV